MDNLIIILILFAVPPMLIVFVAFGGLQLSKAFSISLPWTYVLIHTLLMITVIAPYLYGKGIPDIPFDDMYIPFMYYPGWALNTLASMSASLLWPMILDYVSPQTGSLICIFYVPGALHLIFGSAIWYGVGSLIKRKIQDSQQSGAGYPPQGALSPDP